MEKQSGLTMQEVKERVAMGLVNRTEKDTVKTKGEIVKAHLLTYFNFLNLFLAILVLFTGQFKNMTFMGVVIVNALIGIAQGLGVPVEMAAGAIISGFQSTCGTRRTKTGNSDRRSGKRGYPDRDKRGSDLCGLYGSCV
mgnify:CR=1 FL=1